jgi:DNA helicase II / ATP-dependent DNA helicase PcrA
MSKLQISFGQKPAEQPKREWSGYQKAIFDFVANGSGNAIVEAVAGSGKTTTIVEAMKSARGSTIFLAFNKSIAEELKSRGVNARTFHSLTYSPVTRAREVRDIDQHKLNKIIDDKFTADEGRIYGAFLRKLVGLGRQQGIGCLIPDKFESWAEIVEHHDLDIDNEEGVIETGIRMASSLLQYSNKDKRVDFDDLLYFAVLDGLTLPKFDFVFVDEAQDTNAIQRALLRKILKPTSRLIAVGDPAQAIYGFRGADSDSLTLIRDEFSCTSLPLTVTYRCPTEVVALASQYARIEAAPGAPAGTVTHLGTAWNQSIFRPNDLVLCRVTRPVVSLAFRLLRAGVSVQIVGKDIEGGMKALIRKSRANTIHELETRLEKQLQRETEKAIAKKDAAKAERIADQIYAITCLIDGLPETARTINELYRTIDILFAPGVNKVQLSTIHKAKGLEADRVIWLNPNSGGGFARQDWQEQQERNLKYVAITRSRRELITIEEPKKK